MSSEIKISGGLLKDKKIKVLKQGNYRITMEQVRKSMFDMISDKILGSFFLDLFAGSGIVGIEAISYGAEKVVFVENHLNAVRLLRENIKSLGLQDKTKVIYKDVFGFLNKFSLERFDIIFADPPYELGEKIVDMVKYVNDFNWLKDQGMLIIEHHKKTILPEKYAHLFKFLEKKYGETVLSFYKKGEKT
ncbi:MAG: 16S rRNA (guanine(966)-N(2))-methyltransferase RsmD [Dictyoglomus thermophilum]